MIICLLYLLFPLLCLAQNVTAATVNVDGLNFNLHDGEAEVVALADDKYKGDIIVPSVVTIDNVGYKVTAIGARAFAFCDSVSSVVLPNTVVRIGVEAFNRCYGLTTLELPSSVRVIEQHAFLWCKNLQHVTVPSSVDDIASSAFYCCHNLEAVDGIRYAGSLLVEVADKNRKSYTIRSGTRWIGVNAMSYLPHVTEMYIPESVQAIGAFAFTGCKALKSVTISDGVESIEASAFSSCDALKSVSLPKTVKTLCNDIFMGCSALKSLSCSAVQPPTVTSIQGDTPKSFYRFSAEQCALSVPAASVESYQSASCWSKFSSVKKGK